MQIEPGPIELQRQPGPNWFSRLLANRQLWKNTIYSIAFITYLCSFLFFGLAIADIRESGGTLAAVIDLVVAMYFVVQVIFLFVLSIVVERRRQTQAIDFPDRRSRYPGPSSSGAPGLPAHASRALVRCER
ncbi:MAG: hypothetical protein E6I31_03520 [Chloroflexi bacterium]|nr:MAG: hypothetical protein E6I31_03520 [Chloroflexota bacterium]